jgi:hypothetical protein
MTTAKTRVSPTTSGLRDTRETTRTTKKADEEDDDDGGRPTERTAALSRRKVTQAQMIDQRSEAAVTAVDMSLTRPRGGDARRRLPWVARV